MDVFTPNPLSVQVVPAWDSQAVDLVWKESRLPNVIGYHIWRAQNAPSNFTKITDSPLQTPFFRDVTRVLQATETPTQWVSTPTSAMSLVAVRAKKTPLSKSTLGKDNKPILAASQDLRVYEQGHPERPYQIERVDPHSGLIMFGERPVISESLDSKVFPELPATLETLVVDYFYVDRFTDSTFGTDLYYKVVEVFKDGSEGDLASYPAISNLDLDPADIFWREAMRRNRFIFEQVGEPAYVLLRKTTGKICPCVDTDTIKARTDCQRCWGVGYEGGYDGPYPITFTPPNATSQVKQGPDGRTRTRSAQSFIGPTPVLTSGDLLFRFTGERLVILDVERTSVRGSTLQQTYTADLINPGDYRNRIQITNKNYPSISISTNRDAPRNTDHPFEDPIPSNISLLEGVSSVEISDPALDTTKTVNQIAGNIRETTIPSHSPVFENWNF